ncbi:portal protein [Paenibacillus kandeliae]|uniref:portal protein n=1 Tax=Paenibacillus kandeliae TaxID=3231269 RepID=UPI003F539AA5
MTEAEQEKQLQGLTLAGEISRQHEQGLSYFRRMGYISKWRTFERFKAGEQWPAATRRTRDLPRPVFNIIRFIENHKVANVMSEQIKMIYSLEEIDEDQPLDMMDVQEMMDPAQMFSKVADAVWERMKMDDLNEEALNVAANTGTAIWHFYWDNDAQGGGRYPWIGQMEGEIIDPINCFFGNPQQRKVQKQPWIILSCREPVDWVRQQARDNKISELTVKMIKSDTQAADTDYDGAAVELNDSNKVTVLTRYWRERDKQTGKWRVYYAKTCSGITIKERTDTGLEIYPLAVMQWDRRKKSIYGLGDTEGLIPNQKAINTLIAMQILSVQLTGWPKLMYRPGSIDPSKVTNAPGEMIEVTGDPNAGWGINYLNPGPISSNASQLVEAILAYTRQVAGADEASTGAAPSSELNATAIMLLQKAAAIPIESIKRRFNSVVEDIGRIWEAFFKIRYNTDRQMTVKDDDGNDMPVMFNGSEYADTPMQLKIDVGPGSMYSESLVVSGLQEALATQRITYVQYLQLMPKNVVPYRDRLLKELDEQKGIIGEMDQLYNTMSSEERDAFAQMAPEQQLQLVMQNLPSLQQAMMAQQQAAPETMPSDVPPMPQDVGY